MQTETILWDIKPTNLFDKVNIETKNVNIAQITKEMNVDCK